MADFPLLSWLVVAALADWLITRTLARLAIFMPKSGLILTFYQGLTWLGQLASALAALLTLGGLLWLIWQRRHTGKGLFSATLGLALGMSLAFLVAPPKGWALLGFYLLLAILLAWLSWDIWHSHRAMAPRLAFLLPGLALLLGLLHHLDQALYAALHLPGPSPTASIWFNLGEFLAVLSPMGLGWVSKTKPRRAEVSVYAWAILPALAFSLFYWLNPSMAGVLAIWSSGLTLYLPWPLYALSLWLAGVTVLRGGQEGRLAAWGVLLLAAGGYAPQLSTQVFWGLIALSLLAQTARLERPPEPGAVARAGAPQWPQCVSSGEII